MADGWITIGTELSTDKFDKQIADLEKKMQNEEKKKIEYNLEINIKEQQLNRAKKVLEKLPQYIDQAQKKMSDLAQKMDTMSIDSSGYSTASNQMNELEMRLKVYQNLLRTLPTEISKQEGYVESIKQKQGQINDKVAEYKAKIESVKLDKQVGDVQKIKDGFNSVNGAISGATKSIGRMILGIFSVSSAFYAIRQAMSTLTQYNENLANQIQAIKLSLAVAIEPIVNFIVNVVGKAVSLLGYILKQLFGIDIFARATALSFNKINKAASGTNKTVKELKKQLAGFDEINILNKDGTTGVGSSLGGVSGDVADVSKTLSDLNSQGKTVAENLRKWFLGSDKTDFKGIWEDNLKIISDFLTNMKNTFRPIVDWVKTNIWNPIKNNFKTTMKQLEPFISPLKKAFKIVLDNVKSYWTSFKKFIKDKIIKPIKDALGGIGKSFYNALVPYINKAIRALNKVLKPFGMEIKEINTKQTTPFGHGGGAGTRAHGGIFYPSMLPKLAAGGIINQPRKRSTL